MTYKIAPSIMCCDFLHLAEWIEKFNDVGVDYIHYDVMDGHFVPNITLGTDLIRQVRTMTSIPMDIHLMVEHPENMLEMFTPQPGDMVTVHYESTPHIRRVLESIKQKGCKAGVALNPGTPAYVVEDLIDIVDMVLVMTVNPGFAGQKMIAKTLDKVGKVKQIITAAQREIDIEVDGNTTFDNLPVMKQAGATIVVAGSSSLFGQEDFYTAYERYKAVLLS